MTVQRPRPPLILVCTHMKLGKTSTHGRCTSLARDESFRHRPCTWNRARTNCGNTSIHAHCKGGLRSIWLFIDFTFHGRVITEGGFEAFCLDNRTVGLGRSRLWRD